MKLGSIGARLTLWYSGVMAVALLAAGATLWLVLDHSLHHAVDESLRDRVEGVRQFISAHSDLLTLEEMRQEFREHSVLGPGGDLFQVADRDGDWIYRSDELYDEHVPVYKVAELDATPRFERLSIRGAPLRFLSQNIDVDGQLYSVQIAAPLGELERGLREFLWWAAPALPLVLLGASAGGYWISRRALGPVDRMTQLARSLGADDLSRRLTVPQTGDELERLSRTLNEMLERLESSFRRITRFTADASHELRTPLAVIRTTAEVALRSAKPDDQRVALEQIVAELERASALVDNLLFIARSDAGDAGLARSRVDLLEPIREACAQAEVLSRAKGVALSLSAPSTAVPVQGDGEALRRLFLLLLDNAVKYTPSGGRIEVSVNVEGGVASAAVKDTGIGIAEADLPHVFDRFYRVDASRSRDGGGAGLGLAIGRRIAEAHGGSLNLRSKRGEGSVFTVTLPPARRALTGTS